MGRGAGWDGTGRLLPLRPSLMGRGADRLLSRPLRPRDLLRSSAIRAAFLVVLVAILFEPVLGFNVTIHLPRTLLVFGEVGLAGEIRPVPHGEERLREAAKLGLTHAIAPAANGSRIFFSQCVASPATSCAE